MPDVTVASTTDTQDQVNQAAGAVQTEETEERPLPTGDEQVESGEPEQEKPVESEEQREEAIKPKIPRAVEKRIDKLTREKGELQRRLEELEAKFQERAAAPPAETKKEAKPAETAAQKPTPDNYQTYEEYLEAMAEFKAEQRIEARLQKIQQEAEQQEVEAAHQTIIDGYNEKVADFRKTHEDWEEVVGQPIELPQGVGQAIVELENGPAVAYYLGSHPEAVKKLNSVPALSAIAEIGRISALIEKESAPADQPIGSSKSPDRKPVVSGAPPPIKPLSGHAIRSTVDLNDPNLSYEEYKKARAAQEKARRGY